MKYIKSAISESENKILVELSFEELRKIKISSLEKSKQFKHPKLSTGYLRLSDDSESVIKIMRNKFDDYAKMQDYDNAIIP